MLVGWLEVVTLALLFISCDACRRQKQEQEKRETVVLRSAKEKAETTEKGKGEGKGGGKGGKGAKGSSSSHSWEGSAWWGGNGGWAWDGDGSWWGSKQTAEKWTHGFAEGINDGWGLGWKIGTDAPPPCLPHCGWLAHWRGSVDALLGAAAAWRRRRRGRFAPWRRQRGGACEGRPKEASFQVGDPPWPVGAGGGQEGAPHHSGPNPQGSDGGTGAAARRGCCALQRGPSPAYAPGLPRGLRQEPVRDTLQVRSEAVSPLLCRAGEGGVLVPRTVRPGPEDERFPRPQWAGELHLRGWPSVGYASRLSSARQI